MSKKQAAFVVAALFIVIFVPLDYLVPALLFLLLVLPAIAYLLRAIFTLFK
jgi:hypothetical protein